MNQIKFKKYHNLINFTTSSYSAYSVRNSGCPFTRDNQNMRRTTSRNDLVVRRTTKDQKPKVTLFSSLVKPE